MKLKDLFYFQCIINLRFLICIPVYRITWSVFFGVNGLGNRTQYTFFKTEFKYELFFFYCIDLIIDIYYIYAFLIKVNCTMFLSNHIFFQFGESRLECPTKLPLKKILAFFTALDKKTDLLPGSRSSVGRFAHQENTCVK